ncbi:MAG: alpha/beta hydrolase [Chloroflexota bacterium]
MQRQIWISGECKLEGTLHLPGAAAARGGVVVCHPHPQYGGDMHFYLVRRVAQACADRGWAALRFNFRGVGNSSGRFDHGRGEVNDVAAAAAFLARQIGEQRPLGLAGYSFGSLMAARYVADGGQVDALALIALVAAAADADDFTGLKRYTGPLLSVSGGRDRIAPPDATAAFLHQLGLTAQSICYAESDHFFGAVSDGLSDRVADFFDRSFACDDSSA